MLSVQKMFNIPFSTLAPRQKEVILGRYGLGKSREEETLAAIGDRMGITRERVRQIEKSALESLGKSIQKEPSCTQVLNSNKKFLKNSGGVAGKDELLAHNAVFVDGLNENHLNLLAEASGFFHFHKEDKDYKPFYYVGREDFRAAAKFVDSWTSFLNENKQKALSGMYGECLAGFLKTENVPKNAAENYLAITKKLGANPYGDIGLSEWPEINPAATRDRIYMVLKKIGKPLHFVAIAEAINKAGFGDQVALAPTVHNELIKDTRFVLVGRGMYGLSEQGYEPGIARDVIRKVLKRNGPLHAKDIIAHVSKQRFLKPNTITINLQNKTYFERLKDGRYKVRES